MTQDEILELAEQAGLAFDSEEYPEIWSTYMNVGREEIMEFTKLVADKKQEDIIKAIERLGTWAHIEEVVNAIREEKA